MIEGSNAYQAYLEYTSKEYASLEDFEKRYCGEWNSEEEYTEIKFKESDTYPKYLESYIDWDAVSKIWYTSRFASIKKQGKVYIFRR